MERLTRSFAEVVKIKIHIKSSPKKRTDMEYQDKNMKYANFIIPDQSTKIDSHQSTQQWINKYL